MELDKSKPYGEVFGHSDSCPGAKYEQDGRLFNASGEYIGGRPPVVMTKAPDPVSEVLEEKKPEPVIETPVMRGRRRILGGRKDSGEQFS